MRKFDKVLFITAHYGSLNFERIKQLSNKFNEQLFNNSPACSKVYKNIKDIPVVFKDNDIEVLLPSDMPSFVNNDAYDKIMEYKDKKLLIFCDYLLKYYDGATEISDGKYEHIIDRYNRLFNQLCETIKSEYVNAIVIPFTMRGRTMPILETRIGTYYSDFLASSAIFGMTERYVIDKTDTSIESHYDLYTMNIEKYINRGLYREFDNANESIVSKMEMLEDFNNRDKSIETTSLPRFEPIHSGSFRVNKIVDPDKGDIGTIGIAELDNHHSHYVNGLFSTATSDFLNDGEFCSIYEPKFIDDDGEEYHSFRDVLRSALEMYSYRLWNIWNDVIKAIKKNSFLTEEEKNIKIKKMQLMQDSKDESDLHFFNVLKNCECITYTPNIFMDEPITENDANITIVYSCYDKIDLAFKIKLNNVRANGSELSGMIDKVDLLVLEYREIYDKNKFTFDALRDFAELKYYGDYSASWTDIVLCALSGRIMKSMNIGKNRLQESTDEESSIKISLNDVDSCNIVASNDQCVEDNIEDNANSETKVFVKGREFPLGLLDICITKFVIGYRSFTEEELNCLKSASLIIGEILNERQSPTCCDECKYRIGYDIYNQAFKDMSKIINNKRNKSNE